MAAFRHPQIGQVRIHALLLRFPSERLPKSVRDNPLRRCGERAFLHGEGARTQVIDHGREELHRVALHNRTVDLGLVPGHPTDRRIRFLRDDGVVRRHVPVIEGLGADAKIERPVRPQIPHRLRKDRRSILIVLFLQILRIRAVIGDGLVLVAQVLRNLLGLCSCKPIALGHIREQDGEVIG